MSMSQETFEEMCTGYVLGALTTEEALEFERALPILTSEQTQYLAEMNQVSLHLPFLSELVAPPSHVKVSILQAILPEPEPEPTAWERFVERFGLNQPVTAWAIACLFVLGTVGLSVLTGSQMAALESKDATIHSLNDDLTQTQQQATALKRKQTKLTQSLATTKQKLQVAQLKLAQQSDLLNVLRGRVVKLIQMNGFKGKYKETFGKVLWNIDKQQAVIQVANLPSIPSDRSIQLWFIPKRKRPISAGIFPPDASQANRFFAIKKKYIPKQKKRSRRRRRRRRQTNLGLFAITIEKKGGAKQPTMKPIMAGSIRI